MDQSSEKKKSGFFSGRTRSFTILLLIAIFVFGTIQALSGRSGSVTAQMDSAMLGVLGSLEQPTFVSLDEITQVRLADTVSFGECVAAEETQNTLSGLYKNDAFGVYTLYVYTKSGPYIVVSYGDGDTLVFNLKTEKQTRNFYEDLAEKCP